MDSKGQMGNDGRGSYHFGEREMRAAQAQLLERTVRLHIKIVETRRTREAILRRIA